ncbi:DUF4340 domain-containing protein [Gilvimarinus sp. F26214L]|uniref:DUF4340 domain-containing protein n=1 Tax=Gilvimarinus sp. DZF01 TaxID=3461371 RepID=UPI0040462326
MENKLKILAALLGVQLVLALGLGFGNSGLSPTGEPGPLLAVDKKEVDHITLQGPESGEVQLVKTEAGWTLPQLEGFPANEQRINQLLDRLNGLETAGAVARSADARKRFKVSDESFERKVVLARGDDDLATLYLGTSPGMRRIHARTGDDDAIYRVELAAYDVPADSDDWQDKTVLQFPKDRVTAIDVNGFTLERFESTDSARSDGEDEASENSGEPGPQWIARSGLEGGERLDVKAAERLAGLVANLEYSEVLGREAKADYGLEAPVLELNVTREEAETLLYQVGKSPETEEYTLKVSNRPEYFRLPAYRANPLLDASKRAALVHTEAPEDNNDQAAKPQVRDLPEVS